MHPSGGNHTKYDPPHPPTGPAHDADPAHLSVLFFAFFSVRFPNAFFTISGSLPGPSEIAQIPEEGQNFLRSLKKQEFSVQFCRFFGDSLGAAFQSRFWDEKSMKNR